MAIQIESLLFHTLFAILQHCIRHLIRKTTSLLAYSSILLRIYIDLLAAVSNRDAHVWRG